jgi:hypothetical protein
VDLFDHSVYYGIYRDDGLVALKGEHGPEYLKYWLTAFQWRVNELAESDCLQFTVCIWDPNFRGSWEDDKVQVFEEDYFPFLDMKLFWNDDGRLETGVYMKPNQELKYLNTESSHAPACLKAIPKGVFKRLAKLTTINGSNADESLENLYPTHVEKLRSAGLISGKIPSLGEQLCHMDEQEDQVTAQKTKRRKRDRKRAIYFKLGFSNFWRTPIHKIIKRIKDRFNLAWLRVSMSYHRFNNLRETFQADLTTKLSEDIVSLDFKNLACNCQKKSKDDKGLCIYGGACRKSIVVYKTTCLTTGKVYIGNTQQHLKKRMQQHFQDVRKMVLTETRSDSFAYHFAESISPPSDKSIKLKIREMIDIKCEVLWQGRPMSCVKTFGTKSCALCAKERIEILKIARESPHLAINSCNEIYGGCRHKPKFHRYQPDKTEPSTDDPKAGERVASSSSSVDSPSANSSLPSEVSYITPSNSTLKSGDSLAASAASENMFSLSPDSSSGPQFSFEFDTEVANRKLDRL